MANSSILACAVPQPPLLKELDATSEFDEAALSDKMLVASAKLGDEAAFGLLFARHYRFCMANAYSILRDRCDAEDEVQNAFTKAWSHLDQCQAAVNFGGWLHRIVVNRCLMRLREQRRAPMISADEVFDADRCYRMEVIDQGELPEETLRRSEVANLLKRELQRVPPLLRPVLEMKYVRGMNVNDISARLGISIPATKSRLKRARVYLRQRLENCCGNNTDSILHYSVRRRRTAYVGAS